MTWTIQLLGRLRARQDDRTVSRFRTLKAAGILAYLAYHRRNHSRDLLIECCVEFVTLISTEANDISEKEAKKTIAVDHIEKALTELGFLRILVQAPWYSFTIEQGVQLLSRLKSSGDFRFGFLTDGLGIAQLPRSVKGAKQIADGHLVELAKSHGATLATLDENIQSAMVIPNSR